MKLRPFLELSQDIIGLLFVFHQSVKRTNHKEC
ncbi:Uncharacterised protein [Vibrio cholerae]|nr:Uncharacterised protein [Vibrio cholerae]